MLKIAYSNNQLERPSMLQKTMDGFEIYEFPAPNTTTEKNAIFFAHANGIPAQTYKSLFEKLSQQLNCSIISYDMRGIGKTKILATFPKNKEERTWAWDLLTQDHINLFLKIKAQKNPSLNWIFSGHSLGAWLSLLACKELPFHRLFLFEPPILIPKVVLQWSIVHLLNKRHLSPMSQRVKKRKIQFPSFEIACQELKKSSLMKNWHDEIIQDYVEGSFRKQKDEEEILLRHDPLWEAHLFEEYPITAWRGFLKIPSSIRKNLKPIFLVGEQSDTCNPKAKKWVQLFFPKMKWINVPGGSHMFPLEMQAETISIIQNNL